jgi:membrane protein DedA with SNARE-associated domain
LATTAVSVYLVIRYWQEIAKLQNYGYLGIFVIGFIAGSSVPSPLSYLVLTFTFAGIPTSYGIWHPALTAVAGGVGAGLGGTLVFLLGRSGRRLLPGVKRYSIDEATPLSLTGKVISWAQKKGAIVVFVMSAILNPAFAPMAIVMGALRFRPIKFFLLCVAGNLVKALVISYAGYLGLGTLLRWLGGV